MAYETSSSLTYHLIVSYVATLLITAAGKYVMEQISVQNLKAPIYNSILWITGMFTRKYALFLGLYYLLTGQGGRFDIGW